MLLWWNTLVEIGTRCLVVMDMGHPMRVPHGISTHRTIMHPHLQYTLEPTTQRIPLSPATVLRIIRPRNRIRILTCIGALGPSQTQKLIHHLHHRLVPSNYSAMKILMPALSCECCHEISTTVTNFLFLNLVVLS